MADPNPSRSPIAGGFILAVGAIGGALIGASQGQPTIGLLVGFGAGAALAILMWLLGARAG